MSARAAEPARLPAPIAVLRYATAYWVSQCLFVAAKLGLADALAKGPLSAEILAGRVGAHAVNLRRLLRALASQGIFAEDRKGQFRLTPLAHVLRKDHPASMRDFVHMIGDDWNWRSWGALEEGVKTGKNPFQHVYGTPPFDYLRENPEKEVVFAGAMRSISMPQIAAIAAAYPFGEIKTLVDVGGAHGHMLAAILTKHKKLKGILFDQPQVIEAAKESGFVAAPGLKGRGSMAGGSFFEAVPEGADGYIMKFIIHDWDDESSIRILTNCRTAMAKGGRILVVEGVIAPGNGPDWGKFLDINMLVGPGGKERTKEEFRDLFARAGLKLKRIIPTTAVISVLEAVSA